MLGNKILHVFLRVFNEKLGYSGDAPHVAEMERHLVSRGAYETFKAAFEVDNYEHFVKVQSDAAVRKLAGLYPYDNFDDDQMAITLRSGLSEVNHALEEELDARMQMAGIEVMEARIGYLAYAPEIAQAMLRRQQAEAIVAARFKIVEGAVGMVEEALDMLSKRQNHSVSNWMVR